MNKDFIILGLTSALVAALIFGGYFYFNQKGGETITKTKVVKLYKPYKADRVRDWLLNYGIENSWVDNFTPKIKADCFVGTLQPDGVSVFSYCKLRKPLLAER